MAPDLMTQSPLAPSHSRPAAEPALGPQTERSAIPQRPRGTFVGWLLNAIPTLAVLSALGGLAWFGHHTGWTLPKFAELMGEAKADEADWCAEHGVPESICVECSPSLLPRGKEYGWCKKHGVAECPLCHPEIAQLKEKPKVTSDDLALADRALQVDERTENNSKCKLHHRRIQFASQEAAEKAGIDVTTAWPTAMTEGIAANGEITYDETRVSRPTSRVMGAVYWVGKAVGDPVKRGEILALIDSAEVGRAKSELLQALSQAEQKSTVLAAIEDLIKQGLYQKGSLQQVEAKAGLREAEIRVVAAEQALINLGLPVAHDDLKGLAPHELAKRLQFLSLPEEMATNSAYRTTTSNLFPLKASIDGVVVQREVVAGDVVDTGKPLFVVADTSQLWLNLDVRAEEASRLAIGQPVRFTTDARKQEVTGSVAWISTSIDEKTRTVRVRANLSNGNGSLRANTFGPGRIILREEKNAIAVPSEAVHWEGCCNIIFVRDKNYLEEDAPKVFHVRKVRVGAIDGPNTEIIAGVLPGEVIAAKGSGILRSELLKNNLGAG